MARVTLINPAGRPELDDLVARIRGRRSDGRLINVYKLLLHSPRVAETWFDHINAVRWDTTLDGRLREMVIIRVAHVAKSAYAIRQHVPRLALADGLTIEDCEALADWRGSSRFSGRERAALAYADEVAGEADASDGVFEALKADFDERAIVELTVLIATYAMHARVMNALRLDLETG